MSTELLVHPCFEPQTGTWQYVIADPSTKVAAIIDSVLNFDPVKSMIYTETADLLLALVQEKGYTVHRLLETHAHADHLTAANYLQGKLEKIQSIRPEVCIGRRITEVQDRFAQKYGLSTDEYIGVFDKLLEDDEIFKIGELAVQTLYLPGHTPDHVGYMIGANVFCGDSLFNADVGSARCDFPGGNAVDLYKSAQKLLSLPENFRIWTGHDYPPASEGRSEPLPYMTVADQRKANKHLKLGTQAEQFIKWRSERDNSLAEPKLIHQALQVNIRAGRLPRQTEGGYRLLHVPIKMEGSVW
ncbi:beta-lactamase-like protein [Pseudomassariella vexata]|uniref:Beta-lactamase-like protein n=1 Tax=Pseudomassariella vexata TaxID=1141098 RepID=A0A1Y2E9M7_9PEZI|nr:beta-lactamase-like protein [Pseudomassariella vexata]ORY67565.1 beta-lactamase-like protein [Pseudomassariella vexata]